MLNKQTLEFSGITKYFGAKLILDNISLSISRDARIGLVGENGAGKTTLAQILMGAVESDGAPLAVPEHIEIGYLPQEALIEDRMAVQAFFERSMRRLNQTRSVLEAMEAEMGAPNLAPTALVDVLDRYGRLQEDFTRWGGYELDYRIDQVFGGLDLKGIDRERS